MPLRWRAGGLLARRQVQPLHKGATDHFGAGGQIGFDAAAIVDGFDQFARETKVDRLTIYRRTPSLIFFQRATSGLDFWFFSII